MIIVTIPDLKKDNKAIYNTKKKLRFYLFTLRERGREREREGDKYHCVVVSHMPHTGDLARDPGMCPNWELNW